jgi:hypothetical protein
MASLARTIQESMAEIYGRCNTPAPIADRSGEGIVLAPRKRGDNKVVSSCREVLG